MRRDKERRFKKCIFSVVLHSERVNLMEAFLYRIKKATYGKLIRDILPVIIIRTKPTYNYSKTPTNFTSFTFITEFHVISGKYYTNQFITR